MPEQFNLKIAAPLLARVREFAKKHDRTVAEVIADALRLYLASVCEACGALRERVAGLEPAFERWADLHRHSNVVLVMKGPNDSRRAFKGRLESWTDRTVTLSPASQKSDAPRASFLRLEVLDYEEGDNSARGDHFERERPTIKLERWGLESHHP